MVILDRLDIVNFELRACSISPTVWKSRPLYYTRTRTRGTSVMSRLGLYKMRNLPVSALAAPLFSSARTSLITLEVVDSAPLRLNDGDFSEYASLRVLTLRACGLRRLTVRTFLGLAGHLRYLDLTGNELRNADAASFAGFRLRSLRVLPGNRMVCDRSLFVVMDTVSTYNTSALRECYAVERQRSSQIGRKLQVGLRGFLVWKNGFIVMLGVFLISAVLTSLCYHTIRDRIQPRVIPHIVRPAGY